MYDGDTYMSCVTTADSTINVNDHRRRFQASTGIQTTTSAMPMQCIFIQHFISVGLLLGNYRLKGFCVKDKIITDK